MENYVEKMNNLYKVYQKFEEEEKKVNWNLAIGLNSVDGLKPSTYLENLITKYISGEITIIELEKILADYYQNINHKEKECDIVSSHIIEILNDNNFSFSVEMLNDIHKKLFTDVYDFAGVYRKCNLKKCEKVLNNDTVIYANYNEISRLLEYDFDLQRKKNLYDLSQSNRIKIFAKFTSDIWQVHPYREGNTRAVVIFMIKYLRSLGYDVNNNIFKENSIYFRNCLVLSNYYNRQKNIVPNLEPLENFYSNLIDNNTYQNKGKILSLK